MRRCGWVLALATTAAALGACHPVEHKSPMARLFNDGPYKTVNRLACPDEIHELTRIAQSADGTNCTYSGPDDEHIELSLLQLDGRDPQAALTSLQQGLRAEGGPPTAGKSHASAGNETGGDDADDDKDGDSGSHDHAHIDLPGLHIDADNGHAEIHGGAVTDAGAKLIYLYASDMPGPQGYRTVGYVARGPRSGPLVVGVFKSREKDNDHARLTPGGLEQLVRLNVKG